MTDSQVLTKAIDLIQAINSNNIEETKNIIDYFNENFNSNENAENLNSIIPIFELSNKHFDNPSFLYMLDNLQNLLYVDQLKWNIEFKKIKLENDKNKILDFILKYLKQDRLELYQLNSLTYLAVINERYDLLNKIKSKIEEV